MNGDNGKGRKIKRYGAARLVNVVITALGWLAIVTAGILASGGTGPLGTAVAMGIALPLAVGGLVLIAVAQLTSAQLDTAENTARTVDLLGQLLSRQPADALRPAPTTSQRKTEPPLRKASGV